MALPDDESSQTEPLSYPSMDGARLRRRWRIIRMTVRLAILGIVLTLLESGYENVTAIDYCPDCTASSRVNYIEFFGFKGEYGRTVKQEPVALFVQEHRGGRCRHRWVFASGGARGLILPGSRWRGQGRGLSGMLASSRLNDEPAIKELLAKKLASDPSLLDKLVPAIADHDDAQLCTLLPELEWCSYFASQPSTSQPADVAISSQPATPQRQGR